MEVFNPLTGEAYFKSDEDRGYLHQLLKEGREIALNDNGFTNANYEETILTALAASTIGLKIAKGFNYFSVQSDGAMKLALGRELQAPTGFGKTFTLGAASTIMWMLDLGMTHIVVTDNYFTFRDHLERKAFFDLLNLSSTAMDDSAFNTDGSAKLDVQKQKFTGPYDVLTIAGDKLSFARLAQEHRTTDSEFYLRDKVFGWALIDEGDQELLIKLDTENILADMAAEMGNSAFAVSYLAHQIATYLSENGLGAEQRSVTKEDENRFKAAYEKYKESGLENLSVEESQTLFGFHYDLNKNETTLIGQDGRDFISSITRAAGEIMSRDNKFSDILKEIISNPQTGKPTQEFMTIVRESITAVHLNKYGKHFVANFQKGEVKLINEVSQLVAPGQRRNGWKGKQLDFSARMQQERQLENYFLGMDNSFIRDLGNWRSVADLRWQNHEYGYG